jgi:2-iminobutanoate/2-iminopropanoate deaminase
MQPLALVQTETERLAVRGAGCYYPRFVSPRLFAAWFSVKEIIKTDQAPAAIGPYSQAVGAGGFVFASGQIPLNPQTMQFVSDDVAEQTEQVLQNLRAALEAAGVGLEQVVKTTVYLADMNDFAAMNEVYGRYFTANPPARATVEVARLPRDARVEIDLIALAEK